MFTLMLWIFFTSLINARLTNCLNLNKVQLESQTGFREVILIWIMFSP